MDSQEIIITRKGLEDLEAELQELEGTRRAEVIESIREARSFGDLSENAEYDAARDEQSRVESRINEIKHILANAKVVDSAEGLGVNIGSTVTVEDENGKTNSFTIVGTTQTDSLHNYISNESPAGAAMIGHVVGDRVSFTTPSGKVREYLITDIQL
jgi:transcription elongation factor GreA